MVWICCVYKNGAAWVKHYMMMNYRKGLSQTWSWWNCVKADIKSIGLSQRDAQSMSKWRG